MTRFIALFFVFNLGCIDPPPAIPTSNDVSLNNEDDGGENNGSDMECESISDEKLCKMNGFSCGNPSVERCGLDQMLDCGLCESGSCNASFLCDDELFSDREVCDINGADCGELLRNNRTISCEDKCQAPQTCGGGGEANKCGCVPLIEAPEIVCDRAGFNCGSPTTLTDNCGNPLEVNCGDCTAPYECTDTFVCAISAEDEAEFCETNGLQCGTKIIGGATITCGSCLPVETCSVNNICICVSETLTETCQRNGNNCGLPTAANNCRTMVSGSCGSCAGNGNTCNNGVCSGGSSCVAESDDEFCERFGRDCDRFGGRDNCGDTRSVGCGDCSGSCENGKCIL